MSKYLIKWNCGYGDMTDVVEAENETEAQEYAYEAWHEDAQSNADYSAKLLTRELAENYGHEDELEDEAKPAE